MTDTILVEHPAEHVRLLRLNRPDQLNALDYPLVGALHDALDDAAADDDCRVIVLTGAGRGFCAGLDLRDYGTPPEVGAHRHRHAGTTPQAFLANLTQDPIDQVVELRSGDDISMAELTDPLTGESGFVESEPKGVRVQLRPGESLIVRTFRVAPVRDGMMLWLYRDPAGPARPIAGTWEVTFTEGGLGTAKSLLAIDADTGQTAFSCPLVQSFRSEPQLFEVSDGMLSLMEGSDACGKCDPPFAGSSAGVVASACGV